MQVKIAVLGVGNAGATFIQGLAYYSNSKNRLGLWHDKVGGFKPSDVKIVGAFDIDPSKVGRSIASVATTSVKKYLSLTEPAGDVMPGIVNEDELPQEFKPQWVNEREVGKALLDSGAEILINVISSGMEKTSKKYAQIALRNGISFINATPATLAGNALLRNRFQKEGLVLAGDDLLSQFGGTAFHKGMIDFMVERGVHVDKSYQLDVGGSMETKRTMQENIKMMKRELKTESIGMEAPYKFESVAGTTEYTDFIGDSRNSYYWMASEGFLGSKIILDLTLRTSDATNAGNVLLDVVRATASKSAVKKSDYICAYGFKRPPKRYGIRQAYSNFVKSFG